MIPDLNAEIILISQIGKGNSKREINIQAVVKAKSWRRK